MSHVLVKRRVSHLVVDSGSYIVVGTQCEPPSGREKSVSSGGGQWGHSVIQCDPPSGHIAV